MESKVINVASSYEFNELWNYMSWIVTQKAD